MNLKFDDSKSFVQNVIFSHRSIRIFHIIVFISYQPYVLVIWALCLPLVIICMTISHKNHIAIMKNHLYTSKTNPIKFTSTCLWCDVHFPKSLFIRVRFYNRRTWYDHLSFDMSKFFRSYQLFSIICKTEIFVSNDINRMRDELW